MRMFVSTTKRVLASIYFTLSSPGTKPRAASLLRFISASLMWVKLFCRGMLWTKASASCSCVLFTGLADTLSKGVEFCAMS